MQLLTKLPTKVKYGISFLGGIAVGSVITNYIYDKVIKKKYEQLLDREIENTRQYFLEAQKNGVIFDEKPIEPKESIDKYTSSIENVESVDYTTYYRKERIDPAEKEHPVEEEEEDPKYLDGKRLTDIANNDGIEVIDSTSYDIDFSQFEKLELTYWALDGVLSDEEENIIDDINRVVGGTIYDTGLVESPEVETIFIRNYDLGCDYKITKAYASYKENVIT